MSNTVTYTHFGPAALITLHRAEKRNALSRSLLAELYNAFDRASTDPRARCVILTGAGAAFCAGMDLDELREGLHGRVKSELIWHDAQLLSSLYDLIFNLTKPTIAAVNGSAVAGGAGLVTVCDLAVSVPTAKFGYPEVRRGLVAAMVMPHLLRHVGERAARWMLLTGELIDAPEAQRIGLLNTVVEPDVLLDTAGRWAEALADGGPKALAMTKLLLQRCSDPSAPFTDFAKASAQPRLTEECRGGLEAFFEKRPAPWRLPPGE